MRHSDKSLAVAAEHESESEQPEQDGTKHEIHEVLEQYVGSVLAAGETSLTEGETRLHEKHQHRCEQHPYGIYGQ